MAAIRILAATATSDNPVTADDLYAIYAECVGKDSQYPEFAELLADLECDWYLQCDPETGAYTFYMAVMRDWWRRWYKAAVRRTTGK